MAIVKWRLRRQEGGRGEWSVLDPVRGYRICRFNHREHEGTHVHHPENSKPIGTVDLERASDAVLVMGRYHERHDVFDLDALKKEVKRWKSESSGN